MVDEFFEHDDRTKKRRSMAACDELFRHGDETVARLDSHILSRQSQYPPPVATAARCALTSLKNACPVTVLDRSAQSPPSAILPAPHLKTCVECQLNLARPNFSNANWRRATGNSCNPCASSTTAHPRLQLILRNKHAEVLTATLEEVSLGTSDEMLFRGLWDEAIATKGDLKLDALMSGLMADLMDGCMAGGHKAIQSQETLPQHTTASTSQKDKKDLFRRVW